MSDTNTTRARVEAALAERLKARIGAIQAVLIGVALFRLSRAQKKDPFGTLYGITKFAESWRGQVRKEGEEEK